VKASDVLTRASRTLADVQSVRWTTAELIDYVNDGELLVAEQKPDASSATKSMKLATGSRQSIPTGSVAARSVGPAAAVLPQGIRFLRAVRNMKSDGTTAGRGIRPMDIPSMDMLLPDWHTEARNYSDGKYIEQASADATNRRGFYVYPAPLSTQTVFADVAYSVVPTLALVADLTANPQPDLSIGDEYLGALVDYVLFRAFAKDGDDTSNLARSSAHLASFEQVIGIAGAPAGSPK
jgi:hypothetical protein